MSRHSIGVSLGALFLSSVSFSPAWSQVQLVSADVLQQCMISAQACDSAAFTYAAQFEGVPGSDQQIVDLVAILAERARQIELMGDLAVTCPDIADTIAALGPMVGDPADQALIASIAASLCLPGLTTATVPGDGPSGSGGGSSGGVGNNDGDGNGGGGDDDNGGGGDDDDDDNGGGDDDDDGGGGGDDDDDDGGGSDPDDDDDHDGGDPDDRDDHDGGDDNDDDDGKDGPAAD